jgi:hypothetical protein
VEKQPKAKAVGDEGEITEEPEKQSSGDQVAQSPPLRPGKEEDP